MYKIENPCHFSDYLIEAFVGKEKEKFMNDAVFHATVRMKVAIIVDLLEWYCENPNKSYNQNLTEKKAEIFENLINSDIFNKKEMLGLMEGR